MVGPALTAKGLRHVQRPAETLEVRPNSQAVDLPSRQMMLSGSYGKSPIGQTGKVGALKVILIPIVVPHQLRSVLFRLTIELWGFVLEVTLALCKNEL